MTKDQFMQYTPKERKNELYKEINRLIKKVMELEGELEQAEFVLTPGDGINEQKRGEHTICVFRKDLWTLCKKKEGSDD